MPPISAPPKGFFQKQRDISQSSIVENAQPNAPQIPVGIHDVIESRPTCEA
jgi:hypothetical protein